MRFASGLLGNRLMEAADRDIRGGESIETTEPVDNGSVFGATVSGKVLAIFYGMVSALVGLVS